MGIELAGAALGHQVIEGKEYWYEAAAAALRGTAPVAHLLPNFDEYTVGYRDRSALIPTGRRFYPSLHSSRRSPPTLPTPARGCLQRRARILCAAGLAPRP